MRFKKGKVSVSMASKIVEVDCYMVEMPKWKPFKFCVHKELDCAGQPGNKWVMTEISTGFKISQFSRNSREQAVEDGMARLANAGREKLEQAVKDAEQRREMIGKESDE